VSPLGDPSFSFSETPYAVLQYERPDKAGPKI
jgi:hypothetical protein